MHELSRPDVILTHESDLDGFVSGHLLLKLARHLFQTEVRLEAWNTQAWRQRPMREKVAWVCDLAFDARLDRPDWLIVDHHPMDAGPRTARVIHDLNKSAARLCAELCREHGVGSEALDRLVGLTDVGDLFLEDHPDFELSQEYGSLVKTYSFWNLSRLIEGDLERLLDHPLLEVIRTKRRIEDPMGLEWSRSRIASLSPEVGFVDVVVGNANLIVHELLKSPDCSHPVLLTLTRKGTGGIVASLRSRGGQALPVAQKLQGGGHPNAAGATLPRSVQSIPDALDYLKRVLNPTVPALAGPAGAPAGLTLDPA